MYRLLMSMLLVAFALTMSADIYAKYDLPDSGKAYIHYYGYVRSVYLAVEGGGIYHVALNKLDSRNLDFGDNYYTYLYHRIINKNVPVQFKVINRFRFKDQNTPVASVDLFYGKFNLNKAIIKNVAIQYPHKEKGFYPVKWHRRKNFYLYSNQWYQKGKHRDQYKVWIHRPGDKWN